MQVIGKLFCQVEGKNAKMIPVETIPGMGG
jgi:hypothetical protein